MSHALLDIAAAIERVHKIADQGEFLRDGIFLRQPLEHHHIAFAG
jgi:hypothetical protein